MKRVKSTVCSDRGPGFVSPTLPWWLMTTWNNCHPRGYDTLVCTPKIPETHGTHAYVHTHKTLVFMK